MVDWAAVATKFALPIEILKKVVKHFIESKKSHPLMSKCRIGGDVYISMGDGPTIENADKLFSTGKFGFMREEVMLPQVSMLCEAYDRMDDLKALKGVIAPEDHNAIVLAYTVIRMDSMGLSDKGKEIYHHLIEKHDERGKRIYNLTRGGYLDDIIFDVKWARLVLSGTPSAVGHKIQKRFDTLIKYCEDAVFISQFSLGTDIGNEIIRRLLEGAECVNLHFREPYRKTAEGALSKVKKEMENIVFNEFEDGNILDRKALIWIISKQNTPR